MFIEACYSMRNHFRKCICIQTMMFASLPLQADINTSLLDDSSAFYGVTSQYVSQILIQCTPLIRTPLEPFS